MAGIAVVESAAEKIESSDEHCHEHIVLVHLRHRIVHCFHHPFRSTLVFDDSAEQTPRDSHYQGSRNAFPADVSDTEPDVFFSNEKVVKVAPDLSCGSERSKNVYILSFPVRRNDLRNHPHLDSMGNVEFILHPLLFVIQLLETQEVLRGSIEYESQQQDA